MTRQRSAVLVLALGLTLTTLGAPAGADEVAAPTKADRVESDASAPQGELVIPMGGRFFDDDGNTHEGAIEVLGELDITRGCNPPYDTAYCPDEDVTRAQMATFLARALNLEPIATGPFTDVSGTHAANINAVANAGISLGCDLAGTLFCPDEPVSRAQLASFLARGFELDPEATGPFTDVSGTHAASINAIAADGITLGCDATGTLFCPDETVPRDQMASFLARAMDMPPLTPPTRELVFSGSLLEIFDLTSAAGCTEEHLEICEVSAIGAEDGFVIATGWFFDDWSTLTTAEQDAFLSDEIGVGLSLDGIELDVFEFDPYLDGGTMFKEIAFEFPAWLGGEHVVDVFFFDYTGADPYEWHAVVTVDAAGSGYPGIAG